MSYESKRLNICEIGNDKNLNKYLDCSINLSAQNAKLGIEKESCNNKLIEQRYGANALISSSNKSQVDLQSENGSYLSTIKNQKITIASCKNNYDIYTEINKIDSKNTTIDEKLEDVLNNHKTNQENIGYLTQRCNPKSRVDYGGHCEKLQEARHKKESFELIIINYQERIESNQERLLALNKNLSKI